MKKIILFLLIIFLGVNDSIPQTYLTPGDFHLKLTRGQIDKSKMTSDQKDTIIIDMFNNEDNFFDIAVLSKSVNEIIVYKNCINGNLTEYKRIKLNKKAIRIENDSLLERDLLLNPNLMTKSWNRFLFSRWKIFNPLSKCKKQCPMHWQNTHLYTKNSQYGFYKTFYEERDSLAYLGPRLIDIDNDNKINILASVTYMNYNSGNAFLTDFKQQGTIGIENVSVEIPDAFELFQNYPNPFNNETIIKINIKNRDFYKIKVFDITGKNLETILNQNLNPGEYKIYFNSKNLSSGIYFYKLSSLIISQTKKFLLIK